MDLSSVSVKEMLNRLDEASEGLIESIKQGVHVNYPKNDVEKIEHEEKDFSLLIEKKSPQEILLGLKGIYESPVGRLDFSVSSPIPISFGDLIRDFPKKSKIDSFLKKWEESSDRILSELIKKSWEENSTHSLNVLLWGSEIQYNMNVESSLGNAHYFGNSLNGEMIFRGNPCKMKIGEMNAEFDNLTSLKYALGKIGREETQKEVKKIIEMEIENRLKYVKDKIEPKRVIIWGNVIKRMECEYMGMELLIEYRDDDKRRFELKLPGTYKNEVEKVRCMNCEIHTDEGENATYLFKETEYPYLLFLLGKQLVEKGTIEI